jgi:SAM-dependent methyltransferase
VDARLPFAEGEARLRLLYQLPLSGTERHWLVLGDASAARQAVGLRQDAPPLSAWAPDAAAPAAGPFDVVALPGTLLAPAPVPPEARLRQVLDVLVPGGVVVGHVDHLLSLHGLAGALRGAGWHGRWAELRAFASARRCELSLRRCGFTEAECFHVEPHIEAPMALVPSDRRAARSHFVRTVHRNRPLYGSAGFTLRLLLAQAGLGGALQPQLFFWARKPC